jgi:hypothetical protein
MVSAWVGGGGRENDSNCDPLTARISGVIGAEADHVDQNWIRSRASENWIQMEPKEKALNHYSLRLSEYPRQDSNL